MALFEKLKEEDLATFRDRYRGNDLFCQWSPILCQMERQAGGQDAISLWACSEQCLQRLRQISENRETEIDYILRELLRETDVTTAVSIMCIVLTRLMNAVEKGNEDETFDNEPMCIAIMSIMQNSPEYRPIYDEIINGFFRRKVRFDGNPVVIQPSDPMLGTLTLDEMTEDARKKTEDVIGKIIEITRPLQANWGADSFDRWMKVWTDICLDTTLYNLLCRKDPARSSNKWDMNEKMICNIIGMFNSKLETPVAAITISENLNPPKNRRNYISNTGVKAGTDSAFNNQPALHASVEAIIKKNLQQA